MLIALPWKGWQQNQGVEQRAAGDPEEEEEAEGGEEQFPSMKSAKKTVLTRKYQPQRPMTPGSGACRCVCGQPRWDALAW